MPMPVSLTENCRLQIADCRLEEEEEAPGGSSVFSICNLQSAICNSTVTTTSPRDVNLMALSTRFSSTCRSRLASPSTTSGTSAATSQASSSPLACARSASSFSASPSSSRSRNGAASIGSLPASRFEKSSTLLRIASRLSADALAVSRNSRCSSSRSVIKASSVMPMMWFIGVRISCEMLARNWLFSRLASSASSLARASSIVRLRSVMSRKVTTTPPTAGSPSRLHSDASTMRSAPSACSIRTSTDPPACRADSSVATGGAHRRTAS